MPEPTMQVHYAVMFDRGDGGGYVYWDGLRFGTPVQANADRMVKQYKCRFKLEVVEVTETRKVVKL